MSILRHPRRLVVGLILALVTMMVIAGSVLLRSGPTTVTTAPTPGQPTEKLSRCVPTGKLDSVRAINRFIDESPGIDEFQGGDVGADVRLADGRRWWVFGDTLQTDQGVARLVSNSMLVFADGCVRVVQPGSGGALIPDRSDGVGYWPMSIVAFPPAAERPRVLVMLQRVQRLPGDPSDFRILGPAAAVFTVDPGEAPHLSLVRDLGADDADRARPGWGAAAVLEQGWLYLYGTATRELSGIHGFSLRVARVRPEDVLRPARWRYWDGGSWQPDPNRATYLIKERGGVSQTASVFRRDDVWYLVSKRDEFLGTDLAIWTASSPRGPFGPPVSVAQLPCDPSDGSLRYMPLAHPDLLARPGSVVVSYSRNQSSVADICEDPSLYRPHFLRVPLPLP